MDLVCRLESETCAVITEFPSLLGKRFHADNPPDSITRSDPILIIGQYTDNICLQLQAEE